MKVGTGKYGCSVRERYGKERETMRWLVPNRALSTRGPHSNEYLCLNFFHETPDFPETIFEVFPFMVAKFNCK